MKLNITISSTIIYLLMMLFNSCSEKINLMDPEQKKLLVVEGKITNIDELHYVRLSESLNKTVTPDHSGNSGKVSTPIKDAIVTLSNDLGNSETLKYIEEDNNTYPPKGGYYLIEKTQGEVGRTYTLTINWNNNTYVAIDKMEAVPTINDIKFKTKYLESKNEDINIPLIFFEEPKDTKNYYLMHFETKDGEQYYTGSGGRAWPYSIIDDKYMNGSINGLEIDDGQSPNGRDYYYINNGTTIKVYLESLSEEAYNFYDDIIKLFNSDGGAFNPIPSSPRSNVSGKAQGFFRASAVSTLEKTNN